jgi:tRNA A-37 threonylcarbamoyl transferase component Bud32/ligand-binding sensor domain-containing protein
MNRLSCGAACILTWWLLAGAGSQSFGQQYPFLSVPGAPKNVRTLFQDSRGRLWMGGDDLACFDGTRVFFLRDYGFPPAATYDISEDSSGAIWIGAETGVYRFANGHVVEIAKGVAVSVIAASADLAVAAMGPPGRGIPSSAFLVRMSRTGDTWRTETVMSLDSPGPLTLDRDGWLLYPWPGYGWNEIRLDDVVRSRPEVPVPVYRHPTAYSPGVGSMRVVRDRSGCVWLSSENINNVYNCGDNIWHPAPFEGASMRSNLQEGQDGTMVLAGYNILAVGRPGSFRVAGLANGLPAPLLAAIQARDGTLWLGGTQGLYRFASPYRMEYWSARDGVDNPWCVQRSGTDVYAGLNRDVGVLSRSRQRWQSVASFGKNGMVMNLLPSADGTLLAALNPGGAVMLRRDGTVLARTASDDGFYGLRLAKTPNQQVWFGGLILGRVKREGSRLNLENHYFDTQPAGNVLDVQYEEHTRKLWACYNGGLVERNEDGTWREITTKDGLLVNPCWSLAALPNGDVWYGYYNIPALALVRPNGGGRFTVRQFRAGEGIDDPESLTLDSDQRGWLWRGGNRGLSVADPADAEAGKWLYLNQSDGLSGEGVNSGSYFADTDGSIWLGIDVSIFHYLPPSDLVTPKFAPQVFVSAFSWNGRAPRLAGAVTALPHGSKLVAHIGSLQFDRRNALRLRYRIRPEQSSWSETRSLDLALGAPSSGSHTLEVQGRVFTGPWSGTASRSFTVLRTAWLTWPLLAAYFMTGTLLAAGGYLLHRRRQAEEAELLPDLAAWRLGALLPEIHELAGTLLDSRFEVGGLLARGGFANVMDGYDRDQKQRCAVKVFRGEVNDKAWIQRRFEQEVAALQKVRHPNVVSIYAHGSAPSGAPYLVMEFVEGKVLREIFEMGPLPPKRTARFLRQLAGALDAIHALDICHRDVKPENVIIRDEGSPVEAAVLIDFSIAIVKDANETLHGLSRAAGSFDYMAPEQAVGYAQPSSDIYSLAKLVIEMLTGRQLKDLLPDAALDLPDQLRTLLKGLEIGLSQHSIDMLAMALEFDPAKRPHVAGAFAGPLIEDLESDTQFGQRLKHLF